VRRRRIIAAFSLMVGAAGVITPIDRARGEEARPQAAPAIESAADNLLVTAKTATTWVDSANSQTNILQLEGGIKIELDRTTLSADGAVVWLTPTKGAVLEDVEATIALIGNATLEQPGQLARSGDRLLVTATVRGTVRVTADQRKVGAAEGSDLYKLGSAMRPIAPDAQGTELDNWLFQPNPQATTKPTTRPARAKEPIAFSGDKISTEKAADGNVALVVTGNVKLFQRRGADLLELQADRAVLFTPLQDLKQIDKDAQFTKIEEAITSAYLEGDVRIVHTPGGRRAFDQRLNAEKVFYDFETDRAMLTDAVMHTVEPQRGLPIIMRAAVVRQLSTGEYRGEKVRLTQSSFYTPSYHIGLKSAYVRTVDTGDPRYGTQTIFQGKGVTFNANGQPLFWMPAMSGTMSERGAALRDIEFKGGNQFGFGARTQWGLFEVLGRLAPKDLDAYFNLDYFTKRGPAFGLNANYEGGYVTETTSQPWAFKGKFESYVVNDTGKDVLSRRRIDVEPDQEMRYRINFEHQHFFPDNWQVQVTGALISDPTFQEQWFRTDFEGQRPLDSALYIKRADQTEAFTFLYSIQPNDFVTSSDLYQEQAEIERVPEVSYRRIGDAVFAGDDAGSGFTFFSDNVASGLRFQKSSAPFFAGDGEKGGLGFRAVDSPGLPSFGRTGMPSRVTWRGDFRQELDYPFSIGQFRFVPYVVGRYTAYSQSPGNGSNDRLLVAAGVKVTTAFWKVDDTLKSDFWDLHRLRHVIEPELHVFASAQTTDRDQLFQYDEGVDEINDLTAVQVALRQRWQTKRGGPGRWRSVDFLSINVEGNFFLNRPDDAELQPTSFRGLFFGSRPEESLPRNNINGDFTWRLSDTTAILGDAQFNVDDSTLSTASIGLAVSRDVRLAYFVGVRYIDSGAYLRPNAGGSVTTEDLHSVVLTASVNYQLTPDYTLGFTQSFDFGERERVLSRYSITRHFDRWYAQITFRVDHLGDDSGVFFNVWPEGLGGAGGSEQLQSVFQ